MTSPERIEKALAVLEARQKAATRGPWSGVLLEFIKAGGDIKNLIKEDVAFLLKASTDIPKLIAALQEAVRQLDEVAEYSGTLESAFEAIADKLESK